MLGLFLQIPEGTTDIGKTVVGKYAEGGIVPLSFGLLLAFLLWDAWQSRKRTDVMADRYNTNVVKFNDTVAGLTATLSTLSDRLARLEEKK